MALAFVFSRRREPSEAGSPAANIPPSTSDGLIEGRYEIMREAGRGGMGVVHEAWDRELKRKVAVKRISRDLENNPRELERFLKEARTVAGMRHQNIVDIYDIIQDPLGTHMIFEYVEGKTLDLVRKESPEGRLAPARALEILKQVCAAVDYAHSKGIIHRDLKPANIMIADEDARVKVMDFGIARPVSAPDGSLTNAVAGTPFYMAPEQDGGVVSKETDFYALAVSFYEVLTGRLPFDGPNIWGLKETGRPPAPSEVAPGLPKALDAFFLQALAPEPQGRFRSAESFFTALLKASRGGGSRTA